MIELEFLGRSADAQSVVFTDNDGVRYTVLINDDLRTAVRRERTNLDASAPGTNKPSPKPSQIQSLLRQGRTSEEIADKFSIDIEAVRRYESPVQAEKAWSISQAQRSPVGLDVGSPNLEELVINRLATRGVDPRSLRWSAQRQPGEEWEISVTFVQNAVERVATWLLTAPGNAVEAIDQEAHWLTESASSPLPVSALFGVERETHAGASVTDSLEETEAILDQLGKQRGVRQPILDPLPDEDDDPLEDSVQATKSMPYFSARLPRKRSPKPGAGDDQKTKPIEIIETDAGNAESEQTPPESASTSTPDTETAAPLPADEEQAAETSLLPDVKPETRGARKKSSRRRPVPSWDEIVFGARHE